MTDPIIEPAPAKKKPTRRWVWWICGTIVLCLFISISVPISGVPTENAFRTRNLHVGKGFFPAVKMYASDHSGHFPHALIELEPDYLASIESTKYRDPNSQRNYDWFYVPGLRESSPSNWILLASPSDQLSKDRERRTRITVFCDGHAEIMPATDFNRQFAEQLKAMTATASEKP